MCIHAHQPKCAHVCCMDAGAPIAWTDAPTGRYQVLSQSSDHSGYTTRKMDGEHGIREDPSASQFAELGSKPDAWGRGEVQVGSLQHSLVECVMTITQNAREVCQMLPTLCCAVCFISSFVPEDVSSSPYDCRRWAICVHSGKEFWSGL